MGKVRITHQLLYAWVVVESMSGIIRSTSLLEPCVPVSVYTAPDVLGFRQAHVDVIVATLMYCYKIVCLPVLMKTIYMV